ncbi:LCP family protein [Streptomyces sp. NPDC005963]|uniref:LCP family protein n=1 Tax=Streptomyces sp. NPDC005963 TaxID=3156721 RepID=UPI0033CA4D95
MRQERVRGKGTRKSVPHARDRGWDDSLYAHDGTPRDAEGRARLRLDDEHDAHGSTSDAFHGRPGTSARRGKSGKRRALRWVAAVLSLLILGTAAAGYLYYEHLNGKLKKDDLTLGGKMPEHKANAAGQTPLNILLIGSDARNTKANQKLGGAKDTFNSPPLADVQMLVHLSADRSNISVISMPRDTLVKMPRCVDPDTDDAYPATGLKAANESLGRGGPGCTVATWHQLTGITIDHFMMIDFAGVVSMADAIGGVPVCVDQNIRSRNSRGQGSGLTLTKGTHPVKGEQALQWLRTRYGFEDGTDLARTRAQHMYMNSMVRELRRNTKLTDPNKLRKLAEAAIGALTVDESIDSVKKLYDIGNQLKSAPTGRITMARVPSRYSQLPGFRGKVEPIPGEAEQLFRLVREDIPLDGKGVTAPKPTPTPVSQDPAAAPGEMALRIQNGTGTDSQAPKRGRAGEISKLLHGKGYTRAYTDQTRNPQAQTVVQYGGPELEGDAQAVAKALGLPVTSAKKSTDVTGITVVVGADWREGDVYVKKDAPKDNTTPAEAKALRGDDESACMKVQPGYTF